jgi:nicotinate phosphoribosyltransferase
MNSISALLTDSYQISMAYSYWKANTHNDITTFELFFRKCPFGGEYVVVSGISESIKFIKNFSFTNEEINQLKAHFINWDKKFFDYLSTISSKELEVRAIQDGSIAFPNIPLIQITGPKIICQLLETTLLNITGHPTLIATYARRIKQQVGNRKLVEFGLRRAQGKTAGLNASKYSWVGGFDGTSNIKIGLEYSIPIVGTHAHSYVMSFTGLDTVPNDLEIKDYMTGKFIGDFKSYVFDINGITESELKTNKSELAAFITYAWTQPENFLALIDTFDTLKSGLENYCLVANTLINLNYKPKGVRIDSGDLSYLSIKIKEKFNQMSLIYPDYNSMVIVASNDLDEHIVKSLIDEGAQIDMFGIGTKLSTSYKSPALGMVYKLVEINGIPRIKLSENIEKITIPCKKYVFRLFNSDDIAVMDLMTNSPDLSEYIDNEGNIFCVDPKNLEKFVKVKYCRYEELLVNVLIKGIECNKQNLCEAKARCSKQIQQMRKDHLKSLNPTPYKVSTPKIFCEHIRDIIFSESVIKII